jgi:tetratricopeptide (TPR) repeat protein
LGVHSEDYPPFMEQNVVQLTLFEQLWAWFETNRKQVIWGVSVAAIVALVVSFYIWNKDQNAVEAADALSKLEAGGVFDPGRHTVDAEAYLQIARNHAGTSAAARALLQAGAVLFTQGKYEEARAQFERFSREYADSPFLTQALLGVATSLDAQGKTTEAMQAYENLTKRYAGTSVATQAEFGLARIYDSQGKFESAWGLYEKLTRQLGPNSILGSEAGMRAEELKEKLPASVTTSAPLLPTAAPATLVPETPVAPAGNSKP